MTHNSQWKHEAGWRDIEFADEAKLPEGRRPLSWADLGVGPHSTWEGEAKEWKAKAEELAQRVQELEKRLADCVVWMDTREKKVPGLTRICDQARAAVKQEGE